MRAKGRPLVFCAARENSDDAQEWQTGIVCYAHAIELKLSQNWKRGLGPVLQCRVINCNQLAELIVNRINASGYGLTLGVHTRIDETIAQVTGSAYVGKPVR